MSEFVASNGVGVRCTNLNDLYVRGAGARRDEWEFAFNQAGYEALREYFQHERDEELGRWRPEHPSDYVAYPQVDGSVLVVDERSGIAETLYRPGDDRSPMLATAGGSATAHAYFEAHPEPNPWHDAKPGDIWVLSIEGEESYAVHATAGFFGEVVFKTITGKNVNMRSSVITDARKIWPEPS